MLYAALWSAEARAAIGAPGVAVPLSGLGIPCADARLPALAGPYAVGCGPGGGVDRAIDLRTGEQLRWKDAGMVPGLGPGVVYSPGRAWVRLLPGGAVVDPMQAVLGTRVAPATTDGEHLVWLLADAVEIGRKGSDRTTRHAARPMGWYPAALAWPWVAWVEDGGPDGEDVVAVNTSDGQRPRPLAGGPGHQRHVVGQGRRLAWVEDDAILVLDTADQTRTRVAARTGFQAPPTLWQDVLCWETRAQGDVDITCTDGTRADGPGDQLWPSRWEGWLLYRQDRQVWLRTAAP